MSPGVLERDILHKLHLGDKAERGRALARYVNRTHALFAERGTFSPRLLDWLGVDALKVHIEEDG